MARRLDYIFIGESLCTTLKNSLVKSLGYSDHWMVIFTFESVTFKVVKGLYKINDSLLEDNDNCFFIIKVRNKHNAVLQQADPGTKVTG